MAALDRIETAIRAERADLARRWVAELAEFGAAVGTRGRWRPPVTAAPCSATATRRQFEAALEHADAAGPGSTGPGPNWPTASTCAAPAAGSTPGHTCAPRWRCSRSSARTVGRAGGPGAARLRRDRSPRDVTTATELTAQERQVAGLVRQGLSNRDAAAQLFLSPRTVDFHLRNVFSKLGVASRAELTALPADGAGLS